jgi:hypothetical protein
MDGFVHEYNRDSGGLKFTSKDKMPTCGFIRVQPDGMKEKDLGNRQRYDPVSKRMITTNPEIPPISKVTLSISQPVFVGDVFKSDYIVTFQGYTGCLNYGNEVTCFIYDQTGAQIATVTAKITSGLNTLVVNRPYSPEGYVYRATIQYGLSTFNSSPTQLSPPLPLISNGSLAVSDTTFNEYSTNGGIFSFNDEFAWRGTFSVNFISYDRSNLSATFTITNVTDPMNPYTVAIGPSSPTNYGRNTIAAFPYQFISIPSGSGRTSIPYNSTQTYSATINYNGVSYPLSNMALPTPKLIRDVTLTFGEPFWGGERKLISFYTISYYFADGTNSSYISPSVGGQRSVFRAAPMLNLIRLNSDGSSTTVDSSKDVSPQFSRNEVKTYTVTRDVELTTGSYYPVVEYDDPTFTATESYRGSAITLPDPQLRLPPEIVSITNVRYSSTGLNGLLADFTLKINYNPRNGQSNNLPLGIIGIYEDTVFQNSVNAIGGEQTFSITNVPVVSGETYFLGVNTGGIYYSTSLGSVLPTFNSFRFTSVTPSNGLVPIRSDANGNITGAPYFITLNWNNSLPSPSNSTVTISTVKLLDVNGNAVNDSINVTGTTKTFQIYPLPNPANFVETTLAQTITGSGGFPEFLFKITDNTGRVSAVSIPFRSG